MCDVELFSPGIVPSPAQISPPVTPCGYGRLSGPGFAVWQQHDARCELWGWRLELGPVAAAVKSGLGPTAAAEPTGAGPLLPEPRQLGLGPCCYSRADWGWAPTAAAAPIGAGPLLPEPRRLGLGPCCCSCAEWGWAPPVVAAPIGAGPLLPQPRRSGPPKGQKLYSVADPPSGRGYVAT